MKPFGFGQFLDAQGMEKPVIEFPDIPRPDIRIIHGIDNPNQFMVP
jgi:hypothetical protein